MPIVPGRVNLKQGYVMQSCLKAGVEGGGDGADTSTQTAYVVELQVSMVGGFKSLRI